VKALVPICLAALAACSTGSERHAALLSNSDSAAADTLVIDFQSGFKNNAVELDLDHKPILLEVLTTDNRVGLARSLKVEARDAQSVQVDITLDHVARYSYQIRPGRGRFIGFLKDLDTGKLEMKQSHEAFAYY
jgi:hypothetical protein